MTQTADNPLLQFDRLPDFGAIRAEHIQLAVTEVLAENKAQLDHLTNDLQDKRPDWENLMDVLDDMEDRLSKVWSTASHLNGVCNTTEIREAYNTCQPMITEYYAGLGQNRALFELVSQLSDRADELALSGSQRKILRDMLLVVLSHGVCKTWSHPLPWHRWGNLRQWHRWKHLIQHLAWVGPLTCKSYPT